VSSSDEIAWASWQQDLVDEGLLIRSGLDGLYGRSGAFEAVVGGLETVIQRVGRDQDAPVVRFPPVMPRATFEQTDYLRSFPDMTGSVHTFTGNDKDHAALLQALDDGRDWTEALVPAETMLCSAVCHPLYPTISTELQAGGARWNVYGYVFRHEPSIDPARMQCFRQYEYVYVGEPEGATAHRNLWRDRGLELLAGLGLDVHAEVANDPFFGRLGRMLAANQQDEELKFEIVAATSPAQRQTAITSANCHQDHFGQTFGLRTADGDVAHSACVGFGVERITLALLWAHGLHPSGWPAKVREQLWP
jgi:seryl-tRNA synthetase